MGGLSESQVTISSIKNITCYQMIGIGLIAGFNNFYSDLCLGEIGLY